MLAKLCHSNIPWLYGVCSDTEHPKVIVMSHHSFCGTQPKFTGLIQYVHLIILIRNDYISDTGGLVVSG